LRKIGSSILYSVDYIKINILDLGNKDKRLGGDKRFQRELDNNPNLVRNKVKVIRKPKVEKTLSEDMIESINILNNLNEIQSYNLSRITDEQDLNKQIRKDLHERGRVLFEHYKAKQKDEYMTFYTKAKVNNSVIVNI
jgi:hypothetical protein